MSFHYIPAASLYKLKKKDGQDRLHHFDIENLKLHYRKNKNLVEVTKTLCLCFFKQTNI